MSHIVTYGVPIGAAMPLLPELGRLTGLTRLDFTTKVTELPDSI